MVNKSGFLFVAFLSLCFILAVLFLFKKIDITPSLNNKYLSLTPKKNEEKNVAYKLLFDKRNFDKPPGANDSSLRNFTLNEEIFNKILEKPNDAILKYVNLPYDYKYGSNSIPLTVAALVSDGDLLELGMVI